MPSHRVLIDGYYLARASGYGRYVTELCRALGNADTDLEFMVAVPSNIDDQILERYPNLSYIKLSKTTFPLWEQVQIPLCAYRNDCKIIHFPFNTRSIWTFGIPTVTTVHDLTFLTKHPGRDRKTALIHTYMHHAFTRGTRRSDVIVSVSQFTAGLLSEIGIKSTMIYNTVDGFLHSMSASGTTASERPYFLHRGSYADGHRNTSRIIEAFLSVKSLTDATTLKILGVPRGAQHWKTTPDQPIEYLPFVSNEELASLYRGCSCVIAASLLEGFCLPIIEGFGFGAPVMASTIDPMREIAGDAALLVDPMSTAEIAAALVTIVTDETLRQQLVDKGHTRSSAFSSRKMAADLISLYLRTISVNIPQTSTSLSPSSPKSL